MDDDTYSSGCGFLFLFAIASLCMGLFLLFPIKFQYIDTFKVEPDEILAEIGTISVTKIKDKYYLEYESKIDKVNSSVEFNDTVDFDLIRTVIDASVSKKYDEIKVLTNCAFSIKNGYFSKYNYMKGYRAINCRVFGDYITTLGVYDPSIILAEMIPKREIYYGPRYSERNGYSTLITRELQ